MYVFYTSEKDLEIHHILPDRNRLLADHFVIWFPFRIWPNLATSPRVDWSASAVSEKSLGRKNDFSNYERSDVTLHFKLFPVKTLLALWEKSLNIRLSFCVTGLIARPQLCLDGHQRRSQPLKSICTLTTDFKKFLKIYPIKLEALFAAELRRPKLDISLVKWGGHLSRSSKSFHYGLSTIEFCSERLDTIQDQSQQESRSEYGFGMVWSRCNYRFRRFG